MGVKLDPVSRTFSVLYSQRNPITRQAVTLKRTNIPTKTQAERVFRELVVLVDQRVRAQRVPNWKSLVAEYIEARTQRGISRHTTHSEESCLLKHTEQSWGQRLCDSITRPEIFDLITNKMIDKKDSHRDYVNKCIRSVFAFAIDRGYLNNNPTPVVRFKRKEKAHICLTEKQARLFLERAQEMDSPWFPIWATALYTGMRSGELFALMWDCVDLETNKVRVCRSWNSKDGFKGTKSGHDRVLDIAPSVKPILQDLYAKREDNFVLPRMESWSRGQQAKELSLFLMGMGLPRMRFHDLRASWATMLLGLGVEPIKVMKMGGWREISTMMIYARIAGIDIDGALNNLNLHDSQKSPAKVINLWKS